MAYRPACLLLILCDLTCSGITWAQEPACTSLTAKVRATQTSSATHAWNIYTGNRGNSKLSVRIPQSGLKWKIEEPNNNSPNAVISGGVAPGRPSAGSTPKLTGRTQILRPGRELLAIRFDLQRDTEAADALLENHEYRIIFEFDVGLFRN